MRAAILNRESAPPPRDGWFQIEVNGTWPAGTWPDGRRRRQVIDGRALSAIVNRFNREKAEAGANFSGMLVDLDHLSHDLDKSTEAYAWLHEVEIRGGELWGRLDLSDLGDHAIRNKRVKWFSTEYDPDEYEDLGNGDLRPTRLVGLAFTNRPNNRGGRPISNRTNMNQVTNLSAFATALGISPDADEKTVLSAIEELVKRVAGHEQEKAATEADTIMNRIGHRIPAAAREDWRKRLIANRADTEALILRSFPERPEGNGRIFNRDQAKAPEPAEASYGGAKLDDRKRSAAIRARAEEIQKRDGITFSQAWSRAQAELARQ
jgi:hypothetical protein